MGTIISWIEYTYKDYQELCLIFDVTPLHIDDEIWIDHYDELKEYMEEWHN